MCGRYALRNYKTAEEQFNCKIGVSRNNISPGQDILAITDGIKKMKWGFTPYWADKPFNLINARSETLDSKPSFKNAGRSLILSDGWYEWKHEGDKKIPYFHFLYDKIFCFAGVYGGFRGEMGCAILTKEAPESLKKVHDRTPVIIEKSRYKDWLEGNLQDIYSSSLYEEIEYYQVSSYVNNPQVDDVECFKEVDQL